MADRAQLKLSDRKAAFMFISPTLAQGLPFGLGGGDNSGMITALLPLIVFGALIYFIIVLTQRLRRQHPRERQQLNEQAATAALEGRANFVKTYTGSQAEAMTQFQADAINMADASYFPTSQSWAPGQWSGGAFAVAILLIFFFGLGIFILAYMLIVKPDGTLTVTYERRTGSFEEKTCPMCAERIKAAALVCHFCGHKFAPEEVAEQQRDAAGRKAEFPDELKDYRFRVEKDGSISAVNARGARVQFHDWNSFWKAAQE